MHGERSKAKEGLTNDPNARSNGESEVVSNLVLSDKLEEKRKEGKEDDLTCELRSTSPP